MGTWLVRRYANTLAEARGILAVEQETFGECPYTAEQLQVRLGAPQQHVLVAEAAGRVVGFLSGLRTPGLQGPRLEADLLAVHPAWQGQGIASSLLIALRRDAGQAVTLRGVVRPANPSSSRAFARAGFSPSSIVYDLLVYHILGFAPRPLPPWEGTVRPLRGLREAERLAALCPADLPSGERIWAACQEAGFVLLLAATGDTICGAAELVEVHTLLYSGLWLESIHVPKSRFRLFPVLVAAAVALAKERGLDEVGCLVPQGCWSLRVGLLGEGFRPLDSYRLWTAAPLSVGATGP